MAHTSPFKPNRNKFFVLAATVAFLIVYYTNNQKSYSFVKNVITGVHRLTRYSLPPEQCPQLLSNCSLRVLERNEAHRWIAIWLPSEPQADVSHLTQIPGWKTVVVGDGVCPQGCSFPSCVFLDPTSQVLLGSSLAPLLPSNDPAKKNLAYLYAIKQRAEFIYDTNVNIRPLHNLTDFYYGNTSGLVYTGKGVFNYYKHYGEHWFLPPGFVHVGSVDPSAYVLSDVPSPEVQYGLVKVKDNPRPRFQSVVPTVFLGSESLAPFDSRNTMFNKRAFWGLFTLTGQTAYIVRSYVLQTLLKYIHGFIGFLHPNAEEFLPAEKEIKIPKKLVQFLSHWQCRQNDSLQTCFTRLSLDIFANFFNDELSSLTINGWLSDLMTFGYTVSNINVHEPLKSTPSTNSVGRRISYKPVVLSPTPGVYYNNNPETRSFNHVKTLCEDFTYPNHVPYQFDDILLIITFNYAYLYGNIMYVESLYRKYFPHILFCGPDVKSFRSEVASLPVNSSVAYVSGIERGWFYFQDCTVHAMKMNFNVRGYLQIGEDTLVNSWNLISLSRDQLWFMSQTFKASRDAEIKATWYSWYEPYGKAAINKTFSYIERIAKKPGDTKEKRFYRQYLKNVKSYNFMFHQTCDFFYIPNRLKDEFIHFTLLFFNSTLLVEAAIPTMLLGLDDEENIARVTGIVSWGGARNHPKARYREKGHYLHAFKGIAQMKDPNCKQFFCQTFLPTLVKRMNVSDSGTIQD